MIKDGTLIDERYRVVGRIGQGGMADVYETTDIITKKSVAIKMIKPELATNIINRKRFDFEARAAAALNHPNIVKIINLGTFEDRPYMASEYVHGQTLREYLDFKMPFTYKEACVIMLQLTDAVAHVHDLDIIHCDIKTDNIYLSHDGTIKLGDFGLAIIGRKGGIKSDKIAGSVHYLAPEITQGFSPSPQSDIYAMGVTFFELLTGRLPFDEGTKTEIAISHVKKAFPSIYRFLPHCPKEIEKIITKATKKNPHDRYKNTWEMHNDIAKLLNHPELITKKRNWFQKLFGLKGRND